MGICVSVEGPFRSTWPSPTTSLPGRGPCIYSCMVCKPSEPMRKDESVLQGQLGLLHFRVEDKQYTVAVVVYIVTTTRTFQIYRASRGHITSGSRTCSKATCCDRLCYILKPTWKDRSDLQGLEAPVHFSCCWQSSCLEAVQSSCFHLSPPFSSSCLSQARGRAGQFAKRCSALFARRSWARAIGPRVNGRPGTERCMDSTTARDAILGGLG